MNVKNTKSTKSYFIKACIFDKKNNESEIGFLGFEYGWFIASNITDSRVIKTAEEANKYIEHIINEKPGRWSDGTICPPDEIYHIAHLGGKRTSIEFILSVVEVDINNLTMMEIKRYCGEVSFKNPEIVLKSF